MVLPIKTFIMVFFEKLVLENFFKLSKSTTAIKPCYAILLYKSYLFQ